MNSPHLPWSPFDPNARPPGAPPPDPGSSPINALAVGFGVFGLCALVAAGWLYKRAVDPRRSPVASAATASPATGGPAPALATPPRPGAVKVEMYVMSQCPFGTKAETAFKEVLEQLGPDVDFHLDYIGTTNFDGSLTSMHGASELTGDTVQACAQWYTPLWFPLILCQNRDYKSVATNWESCAREVGAPVETLRSCMTGSEGQRLLAASFARSRGKNARGSPTIYVAGNPYHGAYGTKEFMRAVCNAFTGARPAPCAAIPVAPKVAVTILTDKRCTECNATEIENSVAYSIESPVFTRLDYGDPAGKKLYDDLPVRPLTLPVAVFDGSLAADVEGDKKMSYRLKSNGAYRVLNRGTWNPTCADAGGCSKSECTDDLGCRPEEPGKLEVFVMSECPFCIKGLDAMHTVLSEFDGASAHLDFQIHFIGDGDAASGFHSMHGAREVEEDLRQVCAIEHFARGRKFLDYIWCRDKDIKSVAWETCTGATGVARGVLETCANGNEGKTLLEKSFMQSKRLGMTASPTWLSNGKYRFNGIDAATIKREFCKHNAKLGPCATAGGPIHDRGF